MNNSKLNAFKANELKTLEKQRSNNIIGGGEGTEITCYERTGDPQIDTTLERWPDNGGLVETFTYKTLPHQP